MGLYENIDRMWFGTEQRMGWIETPQTGADVSSIGQSANAVFQNGGSTVRNSWDSHKVYQFSWGVGASQSMVSLLQAYRNGSYGRGLLYFHDPMYYATNLLPKRWADPSMAANFEAEPLVPDVWPTAVPVVSGPNNYPVNAASYSLPGNFSSQAAGTELFVPIPDGMTLLLGGVYTGPGEVYVRTPGVASRLVPMSADGSMVVNTIIRNQPWVRLGLRNNSSSAATITLTGMSARLAKSVPASDGEPFSYTNGFTNPSFESSTTAVTIRRNLIPNSSFATVTGWTPTSGTQSVSNGYVTYVQNTTSVNRLGGVAQLSAATPAGTYTASFRAFHNDASITSARVYLFDSSTSSIVGTGTSSATANIGQEALYSYSVTASSGFDRVYMEFAGAPIPTGVVARFGDPVLENGAVTGPGFSGSRRPALRVNMALNPRAVNGGTASWITNDGPQLPITRVTSFPVAHPLGVTTGVECRSTAGATSALASMYNIDGLLNTNTPVRSAGAWVMVTENGYRMEATWGLTPLTANEWTYVRRSAPYAAGAHATIGVQAATGTASTTARAYFTASQIEPGSVTVGDFIDGDMPAAAGFGNGWRVAANASSSYTYDDDMTVSWTGTVDNSQAVLQGVSVAGVSASGVFAIRSTRWKAQGTYSMRLISNSATNSVNFASINATPNRGVLMAVRYQEAPITGPVWTAGLGRIYWNPTPQIFTNTAPNEAGETQLRVYAAATGAGTTVILPHGGYAGTADVWYDNLGTFLNDVDPGQEYTGAYFDGSSPGATWTGAANASASNMSGTTPISVDEAQGPWFSGEGHSGCRFQGNPTVINYNGVMGGQIGLSAVLQEVGAWE